MMFGTMGGTLSVTGLLTCFRHRNSSIPSPCLPRTAHRVHLTAGNSHRTLQRAGPMPLGGWPRWSPQVPVHVRFAGIRSADPGTLLKGSLHLAGDRDTPRHWGVWHLLTLTASRQFHLCTGVPARGGAVTPSAHSGHSSSSSGVFCPTCLRLDSIQAKHCCARVCHVRLWARLAVGQVHWAGPRSSLQKVLADAISHLAKPRTLFPRTQTSYTACNTTHITWEAKATGSQEAHE